MIPVSLAHVMDLQGLYSAKLSSEPMMAIDVKMEK